MCPSALSGERLYRMPIGEEAKPVLVTVIKVAYVGEAWSLGADVKAGNKRSRKRAYSPCLGISKNSGCS
jgi:hypothetical protein